jgi:hypothetical protein
VHTGACCPFNLPGCLFIVKNHVESGLEPRPGSHTSLREREMREREKESEGEREREREVF